VAIGTQQQRLQFAQEIHRRDVAGCHLVVRVVVSGADPPLMD
jgi:hypothetical protein